MAEERQQGCWRSRLLTAFFSLLGLALVALLILRFGDPQWCSYIYRFQAYVSPTHKSGWIPAPEGYSGVWRRYYEDGKIWSADEYADGQPTGESKEWYASGQLKHHVARTTLMDGKEGFLHMEWYETGQKAWEATMLPDLRRHGEYQSWTESGLPEEHMEYRNGTPWRGWRREHDGSGKVVVELVFENGKPAKARPSGAN